MLNIKEFRDKDKTLPDLLNLACLVDSAPILGEPAAIALNKDGSLSMGFAFSGPDLESLSHESVNSLSAVINSALVRLEGGWASHISAIRSPADDYIPADDNHFADPVSQLIDDERRQQFEMEGAHFMTRYFCVLSWQTPPETEVTAGALFVDSKNKPEQKTFASVLAKFADTAASVCGMLQNKWKISPLDDRQYLTHYHECLTGLSHPVNAPDFPVYLDALVGHHALVGGLEPMIEDQHIRVISFTGYPQSTQPDILEALHNMPFPLRYTTRFIYLDEKDAAKEIEKYRQHWLGARFSMRDYLGAAIDHGVMPAANANQDKQKMADDASIAAAEASGGQVRFGFFTATVVLMGTHLALLNERVRLVRNYLDSCGFVARLETGNTIEAFLGSLPAHTWENVRRPLMHTLNYVDLSPKTSVWPGSERCPSPLMTYADGRKAPALTYAKTTGGTPFRFNLHVGDRGHGLIAGPSGSGKSTILALLADQWLRYPNARVIAFDKGRSLYALTEAVRGQHYDIAGELSDLTFAPLNRVADSTLEKAFAEDWLESLAVLQGVVVNPDKRQAIHRAVEGLAGETGRSITDLVQLLQEKDLKAALDFYAGTGRAGTLLDAREDGLDLKSRFITFELENLLQSGESAKLITVPTLLYLFHRIDQMLDGSPTLITLDEAWVMLDNEQFRDKLKSWLKELRKKNAAVVFATQSLADLKGSPLLPVIMESCPTKIFLPNLNAGSQQLRPMYEEFGLEDRQIELLQTATPKQDYYIFSDAGHRRVNFDMGPVTLAFTGVSDPRDVKRVAELKGTYGQAWPIEWLKERLPVHIRDSWVQYAQHLYQQFGG
ncbi:conjugal transfer protein TrbE [Acidithiobacillus thiooxidans]|uniref:TraG/VirB4 family ATPase n=1 Tax=Acidithiobacillus thiooxidans TaxID=930 RepID=UPI001C06FFFF|nr:conjugal transfer protein TrbE [Acidithiobacillus thiooxidans]MBU2834724.1 conjugal transfer protein TrbE [Acidithiobacillus thiooxidans]